MNHKKEYKFLNILLMIFSVYVIIILSNIALPIVYRYIMNLIYLLTPFIIGFFSAFLLHTLVDKIEEQGINRMLSVLFVFCVFIIIIIYLIMSLIPIITAQMFELETQIPQMYNTLDGFVKNLWIQFDFVPDNYRFDMSDIEKWTMKNILNFRLSSSMMGSLLDSFNIIVLTPIIIYYFLYDYNNIKIKLKRFLVKRNYRFLYKFLKEADDGVGHYFRGLIFVMNLMTIVCGIGFYFIGLKYPLLFGFIVGYTNVIPIIGPYIGGIPAVFFALTQSWKLAILTLVVIVVVQAVESNVVTPYVQSKSIDCHPLLILLAFVVFGKYFGVVGMIFAIPLLAVILLIIKYIRIYLRLKRVKKKRILIENP